MSSNTVFLENLKRNPAIHSLMSELNDTIQELSFASSFEETKKAYFHETLCSFLANSPMTDYEYIYVEYKEKIASVIVYNEREIMHCYTVGKGITDGVLKWRLYEEYGFEFVETEIVLSKRDIDIE